MVLSPSLGVSHPQGFSLQAALEDLGVPPGRTRCGGGAAAWIARALAIPGTQGSQWLGQGKHGDHRFFWVFVCLFFPSLQLLCPSGDCARRWHRHLDHGYPGNARYPGVLAAIVTGSMVLLEYLQVLAALPQ